jgi:hypothetical protein
MMDVEGRISDEFSFRNSNEGIGNLISRLSRDDEVVMESTGSVWVNLYDRLEQVHIKVVLANPLKTKAIARAVCGRLGASNMKTDSNSSTQIPLCFFQVLCIGIFCTPSAQAKENTVSQASPT